jgi:hypothetical protein
MTADYLVKSFGKELALRCVDEMIRHTNQLNEDMWKRFDVESLKYVRWVYEEIRKLDTLKQDIERM